MVQVQNVRVAKKAQQGVLPSITSTPVLSQLKKNMLKRAASEIVDDFKELSQMLGITKKKSSKKTKRNPRVPTTRRARITNVPKNIKESSIYANSFLVDADTSFLTASTGLNFKMRMTYYDEYVALGAVYDEYRLLKVVSVFTPIYGGTASGITYASTFASVYMASAPYYRVAYGEDHQDPTVLYANIVDAYDHNAKITDGRKPFRITWTPRVDVGNGVFQDSPWLSLDSAEAVDHVGCKIFVEYPATLTAGLSFAQYAISHFVHYQLRE